jgi:hypothetical protein
VECDDPQIIVIVELTPYRHQPTVVLHTSYVSVVHAAGLHSCKFLGIQKCGFFSLIMTVIQNFLGIPMSMIQGRFSFGIVIHILMTKMV